MTNNKFFEYNGFKVYIETYESLDSANKNPFETHARLINPDVIKGIATCVSRTKDQAEKAAIDCAKKYIDQHISSLTNFLTKTK
jgi:hypothetical protein